MASPQNAMLVCGGRYHDFDFARLELLALLGESPEIRTRVFEDFGNTEALAESDFLVSYTCDVRPEPAEQRALADFVAGGGRWLALHGTNSILHFNDEGVVECPASHPLFVEVLGSQFLAHPPIAPYRVENARPEHPLVEGIEAFEVTDELYLCRFEAEVEVLLETRFQGETPGFEHADWPQDEARPVLYLRDYGEGQVLYNTLGHCRGRYDMRPLIDVYPRVERGAWEVPAYRELLRRGLHWAAHEASRDTPSPAA